MNEGRIKETDRESRYVKHARLPLSQLPQETKNIEHILVPWPLQSSRFRGQRRQQLVSSSQETETRRERKRKRERERRGHRKSQSEADWVELSVVLNSLFARRKTQTTEGTWVSSNQSSKKEEPRQKNVTCKGRGWLHDVYYGCLIAVSSWFLLWLLHVLSGYFIGFQTPNYCTLYSRQPKSALVSTYFVLFSL